MTLFKQVALLVSLVFLLIVITITVSNFKRSGKFVEGQLQSTAQDMATTLGIAISNSTSMADVVAYETLFNAVFDSGYYTKIELVSPDGVLIHKKEQKLEIQGIPDWFIALAPLKSATGVTEVMQGWVQLGTLRLTLHPGYVYSNLYKNLEATLIWFVILFTFGMVILWLLLHKLLRPLHDVKLQADAIHNNQFIKQSVIPRTIELRSVVVAMNKMVEKVNIVFDDQKDTLSRYQKLLYEDNLTGLGNRKFFFMQLAQALSEETSFHGSMVVIKVNNLNHVHDNFGYKKSDEVIKVLAGLLKEDTKKHTYQQCARLADDEFAILIPAGDQSVIEHVKDIFESFKLKEEVDNVKNEVSLMAGVTHVNVGGHVGEIMANSDFALSQAAVTGSYAVSEKVSTSIVLPQGKMQWRSWLEHCISENKFYLVQQKVLNNNGSALHQEVFVRLKNDSGQIVPAGMFMPMANALDIGEHIDRVVFQLVKQLSETTQKIPIALNLTDSVFNHADALVEFHQLLKFFQQSSSVICVEASHAILEQYPVMCVEVAESVRESGNIFGIDNLNLALSLQSLQVLRPDYIKVNAKMLYDMTQGEVPAAYQALRTLTKAMDIQLIAVGVDSQDVFDHLKELGVDVMQGNLLCEPEEFS